MALQGVSRDSYVLCSKVGRVLEPDAAAENSHPTFDNHPPVSGLRLSYDGAMRSLKRVCYSNTSCEYEYARQDVPHSGRAMSLMVYAAVTMVPSSKQMVLG